MDSMGYYSISMNLDNTLFDAIQLLAEESPRRRMHYDLRTEADAPAGVGHENWKDMSQRILNVMMPDTDVPIHKHSHTSETIIICRGKVRCECYAEDGTKISEHVLEAGGWRRMPRTADTDVSLPYDKVPRARQRDFRGEG